MDLVTKTIDGNKYKIGLLPPRQSLKLLTRIVKIIGVPIGSVIDEKSIMDTDLSKLISGLCERLDESEVLDIIEQLLSQTIHAEGKGGVKGFGLVSDCFDVLFRGKMPHLFKVVYAAMEVEYADFFGEGSILKKLGVDTIQKASKAKSGGAGSTGDQS